MQSAGCQKRNDAQVRAHLIECCLPPAELLTAGGDTPVCECGVGTATPKLTQRVRALAINNSRPCSITALTCIEKNSKLQCKPNSS